jgi:hypothetical protein
VILTFVAWFTAHSQNVKLTIFYSRKPSLVWKVAPLSLVWGSPLPQLWGNQEKPKSAVSPPLVDRQKFALMPLKAPSSKGFR